MTIEHRPEVRFTLFDTVGVTRGGVPLDAGGPQQRLLLTVLLLADGWVTRNRLQECLWDDPGAGSLQDLYRLIGKLKKLLAEAGLENVLENRDGRYRLSVPPGSVDVRRFRALVEQAADCDETDAEHAAALLEEALRIASGEPLADLGGLRIDAQRQGLAEELRAARVELERTALRLGRHRARVPHLFAAHRADPGDETLAGLLMISLYRSGRQTEAVQVFGAVRDFLVEQAGIDVGRDLSALYQRMISGDPGLDDPAADPPTSPEEPAGEGRADEGREKEPRSEDRPTTIRADFHERVDARYAVFGVAHYYGEGRK